MTRWYEIDRDPNAPLVLQSRRHSLEKARANFSIKNRVEYFSNLCSGKNVLDVGVVEHTRDAIHHSGWLHKHISQVAHSCLGVDILEEEVNYIQSCGFNVICFDITQKPLEQKFDVITCGDVLEHLDSPAKLLSSAAQMLAPGGKVVISVPNPWYINVLIKNFRNGSPFVDNADHVAWFDPCTLFEMGSRSNLELTRFVGVEVEKGLTPKANLFFKLSPLLINLGCRPEIFSKTLIYEFMLAHHG
jgi:2-polyprenyl-3-methyl-5-hydroxy-6-metoxy-1,4-benzoquinol methylase